MSVAQRTQEVVRTSTVYVAICDGCGKEQSLSDNDYMVRSEPEGWLVVRIGGLAAESSLHYCSKPCAGHALLKDSAS